LENTVSLAAIGLAATTVAALVWVVKYLAKTLSKDLQEHTAAATKQIAASNEMLIFMKKLNGRLPKLVGEKIEQASKE
jgi:hypothetical protein